VFIQSLGSIGIGTVVAAYFVGKILGWFMKHFQTYLEQWIYKETLYKKSTDNATLKEENTSLSSQHEDSCDYQHIFPLNLCLNSSLHTHDFPTYYVYSTTSQSSQVYFTNTHSL